MYRKTYLEINLDNLKNNVEFFKSKGKNIIGVIKANGYGLIDHMAVFTLKECGITHFAVSSLDEALHLRKFVNDEILILGYVSYKDLDLVRDKNLSILTVSKDYVDNANLKHIKVHIKLNTGMNRIGIEPDQAKEVLNTLLEKNALVEGIMSHFSCSDCDLDFTNKQYQIFKDCINELNYDFKYIHISNTDGAIVLDDDICNYQRIGIGLLGYCSYDVDLSPVVSLYSEVTMVKQLKAGDKVSYGGNYVSDGNGYILTIPIGYSDGFSRYNTGKKVYVENEEGTIIGNICMDQMMVLTKNYHPVNSKVEIYGEHIDIRQRAKDLNTIVYELLTIVSDRITRVYISNNQVIKEIIPRL